MLFQCDMYNFNPTYKCISIVAKTLGGAVLPPIVGRIPLNTHFQSVDELCFNCWACWWSPVAGRLLDVCVRCVHAGYSELKDW